MKDKVKFTNLLESGGNYLGYLNDYPDHWTQVIDLDDLKVHLLDVYKIFSYEEIVGINKVDELLIV